MGLMSDAEEWCWLLVANVCQVMQTFGKLLAESLALSSKSGPKIKSHGICGHETIVSAASRPLE
jgi:hypothetical protein